jgi:hypothetical protein
MASNIQGRTFILQPSLYEFIKMKRLAVDATRFSPNKQFTINPSNTKMDLSFFFPQNVARTAQ